MEATSLEESPTPVQIERIHTVCKKCCFSIDEEKTQVGCSLGMIDRFKSINPDCVVPAYDNEKEFFIINGRTCLYCRDHNWAEYHKGKSLENIVREQAQLKITYLVYHDDNSSEHDTIKTITSLENQLLQPQSIIIMNNSNNEKLSLVKAKLNKSKVRWVIETFYDRRSQDQIVDYFIAKSQKKYSFFSVSRSGYEYHANYALMLNNRIVNNLETILCVMPDKDGNGGCFNKFVFNGAVGNKEFNFFEKMASLEKAKYCPSVEDLCSQTS